jgi:serine/threonine protein kinase/tetratricopeptide (TPR) repeat protein
VHQTATNLNWVLGDYVLESVIRAGGRSTVYTARKHGEGDLRALKLVAIGDSSDRTVADAEQRGAELQQEFARHYGLVPFVDEIAETRSCLYVVMEYVPGEDLFDALARGPLPWQRALDIALELATFLERTHRFEVAGRAPERIIHADLKPGNVRIRPDGHICVLDFGIAKAMAERRLETTQKWGTRQYMSPEWLQTGTIDEQVDYWSLGVLLYEMLAGYRPYRRFERHDNQLEDAIRRREPIELLPPHTADPSLRQVVARLLAPEIRQRYASAVDIRIALEACRRDVPTMPVMAASGASLASGSSALPISVDSPATEPVRREDEASRGSFDLATERVPFPGASGASVVGASVVGASVIGAGAPLSTPPPLPPAAFAQSALRMPLTPTSTITLGRVPIGSIPVPTAPSVLASAVSDVPTAPVSLPAPVPAAVAVPAWPTKSGSTRKQNRRSLAAVFLWIVFATVLASEGIACIASERLRSDAATADDQDIDDVIGRRTQLAGWTLFDAGLHMRADPVIRDRLISLADLVIANYRQEQPTVGRPDWELANKWLTKAVALYPENRNLLARLRYTEGHLLRLNGQKRVEESGQAKQARQSYYAAVQKFRESADLDQKSSDPYLGLTHLYVYGLADVDGAVDALNQAEKRGYKLNRRERAQLGDAYRARGERTWKSARGLAENEQRRDAVQRAHKDFERCVEYFTPIVEFANAADQLHKCEARVEELDEQITPWWKRLFGDPNDKRDPEEDEPVESRSVTPRPSTPASGARFDKSRPDESR